MTMPMSQSELAKIRDAQRLAAMFPKVKECEACGRLFFMDRKGRRYCSPEHVHTANLESKRKWWSTTGSASRAERKSA